MSMKRILSGGLMIFLAVLAIVYKWVGLFAIMALILAGLYEFFHMMKKKGIPIYIYSGIFLGALIPVLSFFKPQMPLDLNFFIIFFVLFFAFALQITRPKQEQAVVGMAVTFFGVLYVAWLLTFLLKIRFIFEGVEGAKLLAFVILVTKSADIGGLFFGTWFGKNKLMPKISPNKTFEGSAGGIALSVLASVIAGPLLIPDVFGLGLIHFICLGFVLAVIGQFGDLAESLIKRDAQVKDSGKMLPAVGGVLDAVDSLMFTGPLFYFYMNLLLKSL